MTDNELLLTISDVIDKKLSPLELQMEFLNQKFVKESRYLSQQIRLLNLKIDYLEEKLSTQINLLDSKIINNK